MTTENVAVLFTDMVGSTALSSTLPLDAADELRRSHFSTLRQAVTAAGGSEVKSLGDGLMVVFATASAALSCAVAMQQSVERDNRGRERSVGLRVGLSTGEVSREEDDYFGEPVIEAARLCAACESGQVLAADVVRVVAGRRSRQECRPLGDLALKGLPGPVATVEVLWEPLGAAETGAAIPLPARLVARPAVGVVGRDAELASMSAAFKRVAEGEGRELVLVSGEAGLGKTTLVAEAARAAFDAGASVLFGHCEEDLAGPYQLFVEALSHYVTHAPEDHLLAYVGTYGSELARSVPALASRLGGLPPSNATDADSERYLLFAAVVGLLGVASDDQPVVLVLDDLQWADKASLLLLRHLVSAEQSMRLFVIGTYRDSELSHADALRATLGELRRHDRVSRIALTGLDDTGVMAFMEAAAGHRLDDAAVGLAHAVYRETDGNPFFVSEVLRHLAETGAISQDASGRWAADRSLERVALPDSVREVIGGRVVRLGPDAARILSLAAVIGRDFDLDLLARATKTGEDDVLAVLDAAAAAALVRELVDSPGRYSFAHALIQHTLYEDLGPTRRARAHRLVAEALEELCGDRPGPRVGELARHWFNATQPIELTKAINYARLAGDAALAALAPADALRYYAQALDLYARTVDSDPALGLDLAIGLGTAQRQTGDAAFRETLLDAARRALDLDDTDRLVAAALANNRGFYTAAGGVDADKVAILEIALTRLPDDDPDRALMLAMLCAELIWGASPIERMQALADEAVAIAQRCGDNAIIVRVLNQVFYPLYLPQLLAQSLDRTTDALARAETLRDPVPLFFAAEWRAMTAERAGDIDEMDRCIETMSSVVAKLDEPILKWVQAMMHTVRALLSGDTAEAEALATETLQHGTDGGQPDASFFYGMHFFAVSWQRGSLGDLVPFVEEMTRGLPDDHVAAVHAAFALAHLEGGHLSEARRLLADFAATDFELSLNPAWIEAMVSFAEVAIECRASKFAGPLFDRLAPFADQLATNGGTTVDGPVSHYLGGLAAVLGRYDDAERYFTHAARFSDRIGAKFFAARTDLAWGRMLAERDAPDDVNKARELLTRTQTVAATYGYGNVERRAAHALQQLA